MKLCVDVGNTTIRFGFYNKFDTLDHQITLTSDVNKMEDEYLASIDFLCRQRNIPSYDVKYIMYSSVVPTLNRKLNNALGKIFYNAKIFTLNAKKTTELVMNVDNPSEVGSDLLADLVAAKDKYLVPLVVIDFGTATKLLVLDKVGIFQSALIMPGIKVAADSLFDKAALLPEVDLSNPSKLMDSKNTSECIKNGVVYSHVYAVTGLCEKLEEEIGYKLKKIYTGGAAPTLSSLLPKEYIYDESLVLDGELIVLNNILERID